MGIIVKICKKHGDLTEKDIYKEKNKKSLNGYQLRCHLCKIEKDRKWKFNHREQHIEISSKWKKNNRAKVNEWTRNDRKNNPDKYKKWTKEYREKVGDWRITLDIINYFDITIDQYNELFEKHNNLCAICKKSETKKSRTPGKICRLAIDHCHLCEENGITGLKSIRGLLCHSCNTAIGKFKDNIDLLRKAILYLEKHNHVE